MNEYITVLAWIFGILSLIFTLLRIFGYFSYTEMDELKHAIKGQKASFPIIIPGTITIICWVWILTQ